jgi:hypothetical protein
MSELTRKWEADIRPILKNRVIKDVRYLTDKEVEGLGWEHASIALFLDDGNVLFPSRDDEGNDAGALFTTNDAMPTIPVIRSE